MSRIDWGEHDDDEAWETKLAARESTEEPVRRRGERRLFGAGKNPKPESVLAEWIGLTKE